MNTLKYSLADLLLLAPSSLALDVPSKLKNVLITRKVTTQLFNSLFTSISCMSFLRPTDFSRIKRDISKTSIAWLLFLTCFLSLDTFAYDTPNYPFPQQLLYGNATIMPKVSRNQMNRDVEKFYDNWKKEYLVAEGNKKGEPLYRIAFGKKDGSNYDVTVSEGQGWGMTIVALMAGYDPDAKKIFDGLLRFVEQHPSRIGKGSPLMAWRVSEKYPKKGDDDSAFDGDADIAYALLYADRQWGSNKGVDYASKARTLIDWIYAHTIGKDSQLPLLGDSVEESIKFDPNTKFGQYTNRTSDFMLVNFQAFSRFTRQNKWSEVAKVSREVASFIQSEYSPTTGLLPDFIVPDTQNKPVPPSGKFLEGPFDGKYYYNACRVPFRIGADALLNNNALSKQIVVKLSRWAEEEARGEPEEIKAGYELNGDPIPAKGTGDYFPTTAFVAPLGVAAMVGRQQDWLNSIYDWVKDRHEGYYEDTLNLQSLLVMTGNYWDPTHFDGGTVSYLLADDQWQQIGLPRALPDGENTVAEVFGDDLKGHPYGTDWIMYSYDSVANSGYTRLEETSQLEQGKGYWIIQKTKTGVTLSLPAGSTDTPVSSTPQCPGTKGCFTIPLATSAGQPRWNMIAHVFNSEVKPSQMRIVTEAGSLCADGCSLDEAKNAGIVHNQFWHYNGTNAYEILEGSIPVKPWLGLWALTLERADGLKPRLLIPSP